MRKVWRESQRDLPKGDPPYSSHSHCKWCLWFCLNKPNDWLSINENEEELSFCEREKKERAR